MKEHIYDGDYSVLIEKESEIFYKNIDILKSWRTTLWNANVNGTFEFINSNCNEELKELYEVKESLTNFRQFTPDEVYKEFVKEYNKTMYLLEKSYMKLVNENKVSNNNEEQVNDIISSLEKVSQEDENREITIMELQQEDPTTYLELEDMGLPESKIEEIINSGYRADGMSLLDVNKNKDFDK